MVVRASPARSLELLGCGADFRYAEPKVFCVRLPPAASGGYAPGIRLKQETLAEEFAVSRTPIREALSRLEAQGIVAQEQQRSTVVSTQAHAVRIAGPGEVGPMSVLG
ncbi:GntR family transcriptional regulator [Bradyrhizobium sp. AZCC 2230]|uniref:GntR family transcriptional regulator n=1 Tax=Bradyrhizobium sp. AZCC 2230 TaxID=3117021 RepID=UPI003FA5A636